MECFKQIRKFEDYNDFYKSKIMDLSIWGNEKDGKLPKIVGTFSNKIFYYPGDIDMMQTIEFDYKSWHEERNKNLGNILQDKIRYVIEKVQFEWPEVIFVDFKAGFSNNYYPYYLKFLNNPYSINQYKNTLLNMPDNLLPSKITNKLIKLLPKKDQDNKFKLLTELFRTFGVLRWKAKAFDTHGDIVLK